MFIGQMEGDMKAEWKTRKDYPIHSFEWIPANLAAVKPEQAGNGMALDTFPYTQTHQLLQ